MPMATSADCAASPAEEGCAIASPPSMVVSVTAIQAQESGTGAWLADVGRKLGG